MLLFHFVVFCALSESNTDLECDDVSVTPLTFYEQREGSLKQTDTVITLNDTYGITIESNANTVLCNKMFNITSTIEILLFSAGNITQIETKFLENVDVTRYIILVNNNIKTIKKHTFNNLPVANILLTYDSITVIENEAFMDLINLKMLDLNQNCITHFNPHAFVRLPSLFHFIISSNNISKLEKNCLSFIEQNNTFIDFSRNNIVSIDNEALNGAPFYINELDLFGNQLHDLSWRFLGNHIIKKINVASNQINDISDEFLEESFGTEFLIIDLETLSNDSLIKVANFCMKKSNNPTDLIVKLWSCWYESLLPLPSTNYLTDIKLATENE
ncbi:Leucine-rich repeat-containing protein 15-like Protein [Tribolium castaneum]|uniref:Leucine-rich repeat-containing protein 15-like Protein n=1 Tax=Tribolium castaneum TaxID=7070 RepID=D2CG03_TRICA|nr:Leucine-rich repeat-containing protein 15-like Protein [Tribolium castaneum]